MGETNILSDIIMPGLWLASGILMFFLSVKFWLQSRPKARELAGRLLINAERPARSNAECAGIACLGLIFLVGGFASLAIAFRSTNASFGTGLFFQQLFAAVMLSPQVFCATELRENGLVTAHMRFVSWDRIRSFKWDKHRSNTLSVLTTDYQNIRIPVVASQKQAIENIFREHAGGTTPTTSEKQNAGVLAGDLNS